MPEIVSDYMTDNVLSQWFLLYFITINSSQIYGICLALQKRKVHLTPEQTSDFYAEHYGKMFFPNLVTYMSSGPVLALVLAREKAISTWRELIGPTSPAKARELHPERYYLI